jgi:hypothetical protein
MKVALDAHIAPLQFPFCLECEIDSQKTNSGSPVAVLRLKDAPARVTVVFWAPPHFQRPSDAVSRRRGIR